MTKRNRIGEVFQAGPHINPVRMLAALSYIARENPTVDEVREEVGMAKSSFYRMLAAAERHLGVVVEYDRTTQEFDVLDWGVLNPQRVRKWRSS